jgi:HAD superfamily hydrolase (TIGR01459 family)
MGTALLTPQIRQVAGLHEISDRYEAILCDIWGVLHNGIASFREASEALVAFRRRGGAVVLISNAPRPSPIIREQALKLGVAREAFDDIVTSGDIAVQLVEERIAEPLVHIGPPRDLSLLDAAALNQSPKLVSATEARFALCTGLRNDEIETLEDYETELTGMSARAVPMICANPDIVIHRGDRIVQCAGALARRYEELGGDVIYAGKPYEPIYRRALILAEGVRGAAIRRSQVLAIGDGMKTDIVGAADAGLDTLFVSHGIHREALHGDVLGPHADPEELHRLCQEHSVCPTASIGALRP